MNNDKTWTASDIARLEDDRLVRGRGRFMADLEPVPNIHHAAILRSPHAHARIISVDVDAALGMPGVVAVLTGQDVAEWCNPLPVIGPPKMKYLPCALDKVRFVGEPVAVVVAKNRYLAEDALAAIEVEYEPLPAVVDPEAALAEDAPILHEEHGNNVAFQKVFEYGPIEEVFAEADVVVEEKLFFPKYASFPNETYNVIADYDPGDKSYTTWNNFHGPFSMHAVISSALKTPASKVRLIVPADVGSSFGTKIASYPYIILICLAARKAGVPVRWMEDRLESLSASSSTTERVAVMRIAATAEGKMTGLDMKFLDNCGGYIRAPEPGCVLRPLGNYSGPYDFSAMRMDATVVVTNKSLTGPIRGYACQHQYFCLERTVEALAKKLGMDSLELRKRNLIQPEQIPYRTLSGGQYDSGDYPKALDKLLEMSKYQELLKARDEARAQGRLVGIGIALGVDPSASNMGYVQMALPEHIRNKRPLSGAAQATTINMDNGGNVLIDLSTVNHGQGHETVAAQLVASVLGIKPEQIRVTGGMDTNTKAWTFSTGSYSSRFGTVGSSSVLGAAQKLAEKIKRIAAYLLDVDAAELQLAEGKCVVAGTEKAVSLREVASAAHWDLRALPPGEEPGLSVTHYFQAMSAGRSEGDGINSSCAYGFGAYLAVVEVDPETFAVQMKDYFAVHDAGVILNHAIAEGQTKGAAIHGFGAALYEELLYDQDGQFLNSTFMDYICPGIGEIPKMTTGYLEIETPVNPLGAKGIGEASSQTGPVVIANAVEDALSPLKVDIKRVPLPPHYLWGLAKA